MTEKEKSTKKAVAIKYNPETDGAPKVSAKGRGYIADKILEVADKFDIPVKEDRDLIELLYKIEIEEEIPSELYVVVAEILAFVYRVNKRLSTDGFGIQ